MRADMAVLLRPMGTRCGHGSRNRLEWILRFAHFGVSKICFYCRLQCQKTCHRADCTARSPEANASAGGHAPMAIGELSAARVALWEEDQQLRLLSFSTTRKRLGDMPAQIVVEKGITMVVISGVFSDQSCHTNTNSRAVA